MLIMCGDVLKTTSSYLKNYLAVARILLSAASCSWRWKSAPAFGPDISQLAHQYP